MVGYFGLTKEQSYKPMDISSALVNAAWWGEVDKWSLVVVIVAVIGEGISEYSPTKFKTCWLMKRLGRVSWLLLVAGLVGETSAQLNKDGDNDLVIAALKAQLETARGETARADANLLKEQRLTARERWRLERLERIILPRSIDPSTAGRIGESMKAAAFQPINLAVVDQPEPTRYGLDWMITLRNAGLLASITYLPANSTAPSLLVVAVDKNGDKIADLLFQKFHIGEGWKASVADARKDPSLVGIPMDRNCIVIGSNANAAFQGAEGQPGEGLDRFGRPVPAPQ
jgi:hypothetical protein